MSKKENKPFDPWTATEEEAKAEEENRTQLRKVLSEELRKHELGSDKWHEVRQQLWSINHDAVTQYRVAKEALKMRQQNQNGYDLVSLIDRLSMMGLTLPYWLVYRFHDKITPIFVEGINDWNKVLGRPYSNRKAGGQVQQNLNQKGQAFFEEVCKTLVYSFHERITPIFLNRIDDWNKIFGKPYKVQQNLRQEVQAFFNEIRETIKSRQAARVNETIEAVGEKFGMQPSAARKVYNFWKVFSGYDPAKATKDLRTKRIKRNEKAKLSS